MTGDSQPRFRGVLLDWRGTLVVAPTFRWLVETALGRVGRDATPSAVERVLDRLRGAGSSLVGSSEIDTDAVEHRAAYLEWFASANLDDEFADALYSVESDASLTPFADDVGDLLRTLTSSGVRVGVVSDIHVDLRQAFAQHSAGGGRTWADLVDVWALSYELGVAKPDPAIFRFALDGLGLPPHEVLMVGDRGAWDGAAAEIGITTLVLPPLTDVRDARLHRVLDLVLPGAQPWHTRAPTKLGPRSPDDPGPRASARVEGCETARMPGYPVTDRLAGRTLLVAASYLVLRRDDSVLLQLRRGTGYMDAWWALLAGHVDPGESVHDAAVREAREESTIEVAPADLVPLTAVHRFEAGGPPVEQRVDVFFETWRWAGEPCVAEPMKCAAMQWFPLDDLPDDVVPHERLVLEGLRTGNLPAVMTVRS